MPDVPRYPAEDEPAGGDAGDRPPTSWGTYLLVAAGIALVVLVIVLHLTGVLGPEAH